MTIYRRRPPEEPKFHARQYDGIKAEAFVGFLRGGATCVTTNTGYGVLRHEISVMISDASVPVLKGQWVVYDEDGGARVMSDQDFRAEFEPEEVSYEERLEHMIMAENIKVSVDEEPIQAAKSVRELASGSFRGFLEYRYPILRVPSLQQIQAHGYDLKGAGNACLAKALELQSKADELAKVALAHYSDAKAFAYLAGDKS